MLNGKVEDYVYRNVMDRYSLYIRSSSICLKWLRKARPGSESITPKCFGCLVLVPYQCYCITEIFEYIKTIS